MTTIASAPALLFLQAHPDDECILTGSTLAKAASLGLRTIIVYGTRGDAGETNKDLGGESLGDRRVKEALAACAQLKVTRVEWLPYDDSGMADTETTKNPQAFSNADPQLVAEQLVTLLSDENIAAVIGYDANGTYGHPDHKQVHHVAHAVAPKLGASWVLDATYNREYLAGLPDADGTLDPNYAASEADLTHFVAGEEWLQEKWTAIANHLSQVPDDIDLDASISDGFRERFATEWFITAPVVPGDAPEDLGVLAELLEPKSAWLADLPPSSDSTRVMTLPILEGVLNFRELGGLAGAGGTVRPGRIFRSGHLATATDDDLASLTALGIGSVIDFRLDADKRGDGGPDRVPSGATLIELPMSDPGGHGKEIRETLMSGDQDLMEQRYGNGRAHALAIEGAVAQASDPDKHPIYAAFLDHVASAEHPVLFHCSAGKDRAGWAATVVGLALGVDDQALVEHYLLSNVHRPPEQRKAYYEARGVNVDLVMPFLGVHEDYIRASIASVTENFGSRESYLSEALNFGPDRVAAFRAAALQ